MSTILITGANKGIGLEMTKQYSAAGHSVIACCRDAAKATDLQAVAGVQVEQVQVSDAASVAALADKLQGKAVDLIINNAGMAGPEFTQQTVLEMDYQGFAETFEVNTMAPMRVMQALMDNLKASSAGKVISITSQMGALALDMPMAYAYCASKAALNKLMKLAAVELGQQNIAVGVIHPGWVKTDMGGPAAEITAQQSATGILAAIEKISVENNGKFLTWEGEEHPW